MSFTNSRLKLNKKKTSGSAIDYYGVVDPLADDMKAIDQQLGGHLLDQQSELKSTLIFGADKWGQDVLKKNH